MDGEAGRGGRNPVPAKKKIMDRTIFTGGNGFRGRRQQNRNSEYFYGYQKGSVSKEEKDI